MEHHSSADKKRGEDTEGASQAAESADLGDHSVSICIASYNMADTIEESLTSITRDLPESFEIVIVDQSNDGSTQIIEDVSERTDLSFSTISTEYPLGVGHARNLALCAASGDIVITHVDADDWYDSRYFPALVELYLMLRQRRGDDFFFSCPNMNISSKDHMMANYLLTSLPIGANEKEYRWKAVSNDDYLGLTIDRTVSERIKLSERKTIWSRMQRTYRRQLGMYLIGYSSKRIVEEDIFLRSWSLHSKAFRAVLLPFTRAHALLRTPLCDAPSSDAPLPQLLEQNTYTLAELWGNFDLGEATAIANLTDEG